MTDAVAPKVADPRTVLHGSSAIADHTGRHELSADIAPTAGASCRFRSSFWLLFPFYWMALTAIKPDEQLLDLGTLQSILDWTPLAQAFPKAAV